MLRVAIKEIILSFKRTGNFSRTAQELGISRWTVKRWVRRGTSFSSGYLKWTGLKRKSTKPHALKRKLTAVQENLIISFKKKEHLGAKKIKYLFPSLKVSFVTIHRLLQRKNLVTIPPQYRRPLFQNGKAMRPSNTKELGYLQMDTKHITPELSGLTTTVYEYAAIDIVSRYKLAVILPDISDESASLALKFFLKWFPFKVGYIQTDNGLEFQKSFDHLCQEENIKHYFIHKNSPNENAVIERSFRTDQDEFYYWLETPPKHTGELNQWLQNFLQKYNTWRPHQALNYQTPLQVVKLLQMS